ncbi:hypothetical protein KGQ20_13780 [Catenulispora sp. NF23]|uniref:hypothetical protein n=1 Tax=Catenulispora pinistramenti TaxID=2705254 RepID=UPI001BA892B9|nr:hypothetical protein [Catenulispora pinistramenti]MBS2533838.1 hypothetical protein [Catenulispora pinistramenti]
MSMTEALPQGTEGLVSVLRLSRIIWARETLEAQKIHPFFLAYLHLTASGAKSRTTPGIEPHWQDLQKFIEVPGGPSGSPNYRPFWHQNTSPGSPKYWLNENLPGSFAPGSLRDVPKRIVETDDDGRFVLKENHYYLALQNLLYGQQVPALAVAAYFYRNFGFQDVGESTAQTDLIAIFREDFGFANDQGFSTLFSVEPLLTEGDWFEPLSSYQGPGEEKYS